MFRQRNISCVRLLRDICDQAGNAASAAAIALSTSAAVQQGTSAMTSPVLESLTGIHFSVRESLHSPFTQYCFRIIGQPLSFDI